MPADAVELSCAEQAVGQGVAPLVWRVMVLEASHGELFNASSASLLGSAKSLTLVLCCACFGCALLHELNLDWPWAAIRSAEIL